ncbi:MAG: efflux RND transporter permease subunit, partial [Pirellulaceae bacterium]|nr:efflux RND transporter permease subunit [Pirellulaceae bacterium]
MHPIEAFVRNPVKVTVGVLLLALFGVVALLRMPMQLTPEVEIPTISIETRWPGASPQEIEREIIQEQEEQLKSVEGVTKMTSECMDSNGTITLEFIVGTNMEEALLKVNSRLQQVSEYPEDADEPVISTSSSSDRPIAWFILSARFATDEQIAAFQEAHPELRDELQEVRESHNPGLAELRLRRMAAEHPEVEQLLPNQIDVPKLRRFCEDVIEAQFERVPGVSNANVMGGEEEELQVVVDPQKLAARELTITDVRNALRAQNKDTSGGDLWEGKRRYVVRTLGQFRSPEQVEQQILTVHNGDAVLVRDVAQVRMGHKKPDGFVRRFGTRAIAVNAVRETGANVLDVMAGLQEANRQLNEGVLASRGLLLTQVYDETDYIYSAVGLVNENIILGGSLTVIILMLFLHLGVRTLLVVPLLAASALAAILISPWFFALTLLLVLAAGLWFARGALVVSVAIPISIIGTFLILQQLGRSLNVISLAGLAFAVGMLVDNAVVVLENIYRYHQEGDPPFTAAVRGTKDVWGAVVASTLTTLAVFLPVLFVQEEAGQLFRDIALAISSAVALSLVVSVTVIPVAAARLLRREDQQLARHQASS